MADSALSLTKAAVEGTVGRVLVAIDEDKKLKAAAQEDLRFIVAEFQIMRAFLEEANDNKERTGKKVVKAWVRQLRELAFDVEDCVEFVIHLDTTSTRGRWSWVWRMVPSRFTPAWAGQLDEAVAQLKQLKARVEEVSQRNTRYNLLGGEDSGSSTTLPSGPPEQLNATAFPSTVDILRDLWKANGKQSSSSKCNVKHLVADGRSTELRVISVWRSARADLEAEHVLNAAYFDSEICEEFKVRAWVKMVQPFNIQEFLKSLLNQLYVTSLQLETGRANLLRTNGDSVIQDELRQLLSKHKYLIILEDLSSRVEWDLIRLCLPDCHNGSRIVISTQQLEIALSCMGEPYRVLQLALLPDNHRYIFAFYKASGIGIKELVQQLGHRRVISLWGDRGGDTSSLVRDVYEAMRDDTAEFKGLKFERFNWADVTASPFNLEGFCRWLDDEESENSEDEESGNSKRDSSEKNPKNYFADLSKKLCKSRQLIVIDGLQSTEDWDSIKDAGLVPEDTKSCIVIIANDEAVVQHCKDNSYRKMDAKEKEEANHADIIFPFKAEEEYTWAQDNRFNVSLVQKALLQLDPFITSDQEEILQHIINNCDGMIDYGVIALWGAPGVGKSALLRFLYYSAMAYSLNTIEETNKLPKRELLMLHDPESWTRFERFGWVDVPEPFDLVEFSRRLLLDFNLYDLGEMEKTALGLIQGYNNPIERCYETVCNHKCLVVIDGLRSTHDWDSIKQAIWRDYYQESCIFVTTIEESVAEYCHTKGVGYRRFISVKALDVESAHQLFKKIVDRKGNENAIGTHYKLKHANHIVPKCGGLPKIIDAVANNSDYLFWQNINVNLVTNLKNDPQCDHLRGILSWMQSYFDGCSDSVKPCVFYLSVFPTNYKIRKAHLLRRWTAEGYCRDTIGCSAKENADNLFKQLIHRDIIQDLSGWFLNGFFREYIISQQMEDNFVFALEGQCKPNSQRTVQHLSIMEDWEREKHVFQSIDVSRLRSLTVYGKWETFFISDKMKRIRVLDLQGTFGVGDCCLEHIFEILLSLKFICLRGCKSIKRLPKTLGGLRQLESLDVSGTSIVTLPRAIIKLQKIQYIRAGWNFGPDEDCTSAKPEDNDDAVGSQQPSGTGTTDKQVDAASSVSQDKCDDSVGSQQPSGRTPTPEAEGSDDDVDTRSPLPLLPQDNKQVDGARQKKSVGCCWTSSKLSQDSDDAVGSQQRSGTATRTGPAGGQTTQPLQAPKTKGPQASGIPGPALMATSEAEDNDGSHQGQHQHHKQQYHNIKKVGRRCTSRLSSQLSPLWRCSCFDDNNIINGGVEVPVGIEDMPVLHTLGIVNINGAHGKEFLAKLSKGKTKFPQLLKLSVCGIKKDNWKDFCGALSANHHLKSLSVVLDEDFTEDIYFDNPPKALSIKVYRRVHRIPASIKDNCLGANLEDWDIEKIISTHKAIEQLVQSLSPLPTTRNIRRVFINEPNPQGRELDFKEVMNNDISRPLVLNIIDCSLPSHIAPGSFIRIVYTVNELTIYCAPRANFRISSNEESGLNNLLYINTVCLMGVNEEAEYVAPFKEHVDAHPRKPVFKFQKLVRRVA